MSAGGRCVKHDNWHAHCQQCCREEPDDRPMGPSDGEVREQERMRAEVRDLRAQRDDLAEALRIMWMEFGGKARTALVPADLAEVSVALDIARAALSKVEP